MVQHPREVATKLVTLLPIGTGDRSMFTSTMNADAMTRDREIVGTLLQHSMGEHVL